MSILAGIDIAWIIYDGNKKEQQQQPQTATSQDMA